MLFFNRIGEYYHLFQTTKREEHDKLIKADSATELTKNKKSKLIRNQYIYILLRGRIISISVNFEVVFFYFHIFWSIKNSVFN